MMASKRILLLYMFLFLARSVLGDIRSMTMSVKIGWRFQCANTTCLPFVNVTTSSILLCQIACLAEVSCQAASFQQTTTGCELFDYIPDQNSIVPVDVDTVTMIVMSGTRIPIASTTGASTITNTYTTSTNTTISTSTTSGTSSASSTSTTSRTTTTTTSIYLSPSLWLFDNNTLDSLSIFNGVGVNSPTYKTPGINGYGAALSLIPASSQYVNVSRHRNFAITSFTIEMWFYWTDLTSDDYGLFSQNQAPASDQSLHILIRNYNLYMGFYGDDLTASTYLQTNTWYHAAFVFDYSSLTQFIYVNGRLDGNRSASPYQGTSGSIVIGKTEENGTPNYFSGYIDQVSIVMRAKSSTEILDDATLVTWHSFDNPISYSDSGSLNLNVESANIISVSGRVNQAVSFTPNSSYYQINGFVLLGISNYSYSIALWVNPSSIGGSTLVHISTTTDGQGWCVDSMGFSSSGQIVSTGWHHVGQQVIGPVLPANVWTHVVGTYSLMNGIQLYVNGTFIGSTGSTIYVASGLVNILTLGNGLQGTPDMGSGGCNSQSIVPNAYDGLIDEFRVYSRELDAADIYTLANP